VLRLSHPRSEGEHFYRPKQFDGADYVAVFEQACAAVAGRPRLQRTQLVNDLRPDPCGCHQLLEDLLFDSKRKFRN
jgi:hypothetical protein